MCGMTETPTAGTAVLDARPVPLADHPGIRERAEAAMTAAGLTTETLGRRIPLPNIHWQKKIAAALAGDRPFSSLTIALFAQAVGADVLWLITGAPSPAVTVRACVIAGADTAEAGR